MHAEGSVPPDAGRPRRLLGLAALLAAVAGCGAKTDVVPLTDSEKRLTYVALAYVDAHSALGRAPKSADELKPHLKQFGNPDELLVSPNDGQTYGVAWGADPGQGGPTPYQGMFPILAYE